MRLTTSVLVGIAFLISLSSPQAESWGIHKLTQSSNVTAVKNWGHRKPSATHVRNRPAGRSMATNANASSPQEPPDKTAHNVTTTTPFPFSLLYQHCGFDVPDGKECYAEVNLVCNDHERTQWSICVCSPGTEPHPHGSLTCVPPTKIIPVGESCNPNATLEEEQCRNELAYCGKNGTCICGDDGWGQVQYDSVHKDCYLKSNPTHNHTNGDMKLTGHRPTLLLTVLLTPFHRKQFVC